MPWPWSASASEKDDANKRRRTSWTDSLNATNWGHYTSPSVVIPSTLLTLTTLATIGLYKRYLRRIPNANHISPDHLRKRSIFGQVTSVGDGDNFRLFHTPGGRFAGWGWLRRVPTERTQLSAKTVLETFPSWYHSDRGNRHTDPCLDSRKDSWCRCTRTSTLWPTRPTLQQRSIAVAYSIRPTQTGSRICPQT